MTIDELRDLVTALELADDARDVMTPLTAVIDGAEPLLVAAESGRDTSMVGEIARELQRAFEAVAERADPATRTRLLVGASFWSLRAASADIEDVASADYRSMVMLPGIGGGDAAQLDLAPPVKTLLSATDDAPPVPGLLTTTNVGSGSDVTDLAPPPGLASGSDTAATLSGDTQTATSALTPVAFTDNDS